MPNGNNFYQSTSNWEKGYKLFQPFENIYGSAANLGGQLSDFTSPFYSAYRSYLSKMTPTLGTNALLAPLQAGGGNYAASQAQANVLQQNYLSQRNDFLNKGVQGFASQNLSMLPSLYQIMTQAASIPRGIQSQNDINASNQPGFLDWAGSLLGNFTGQSLSQFGNYGGSGGGGGTAPTIP